MKDPRDLKDLTIHDVKPVSGAAIDALWRVYQGCRGGRLLKSEVPLHPAVGGRSWRPLGRESRSVRCSVFLARGVDA